MGARRMVDAVAPSASSPPLERGKLCDGARKIEQVHLLRIHEGEKVAMEIGLGLLGKLVLDTELPELLAWPFTGVAVAGDAAQAIVFEEAGELSDNDFGEKGGRTSRTARNGAVCRAVYTQALGRGEQDWLSFLVSRHMWESICSPPLWPSSDLCALGGGAAEGVRFPRPVPWGLLREKHAEHIPSLASRKGWTRGRSSRGSRAAKYLKVK